MTTNQRGETAAAEVWVLVTGMNEAPEFVRVPVVSVQADARTVAGAQDRSFLVGATGEVTLELVSGDKTKIEAGLYRVDDSTGRIGTLRPGDGGYLEAALSAERALVGFNSRALAGATQSLALIEGEFYGAYLIVSPRRIATPGAAPVGPAPFSANVYFSFEGANAEAYDHLRAQVVNGALELRWENGLHTLDRDDDDLVLRITGFELGGEAQYVYDAQAVDNRRRHAHLCAARCPATGEADALRDRREVAAEFRIRAGPRRERHAERDVAGGRARRASQRLSRVTRRSE